jgi:choline dehydrogenase
MPSHAAGKFDYIVVGAGSAGCVLARRLSDDPAIRVLLLEAGPPAQGFWVQAPAGMAKLFKNPRYNWGYFTDQIPTLCDRTLYWPRGKALGGSSTINGLVYVRGNRGDFDHWASLGNPGWGWYDVLPHFKAIENYGAAADPLQGSTGALVVSDPAIKHPTAVDFIESASRVGIPKIQSFNGTEPEGVGFLQANIKNGIRQSSYDAFLKPVSGRSNLTIETGVHVVRVVTENRRAIGVDLLQGNEKRFVAASREVIVSAGALNSPKVLMLSGIGDGEELQRHGIATILHLPGVGKNLQDHFVARIQAVVTPESSYNRSLNGWRMYAEGMRYLATRGGYLALASSMAGAFVKSAPELEYSDLEISFRPMTFTHQANGKVTIDNIDAVGASVYNTRPTSRGQVLLRSPNPLDAPRFQPNFLSHSDDVHAMVSGVRKLREIYATKPLAGRVVSELIPGKEVATDGQLLDYLRREGHCAFHPAGSCKMGNDAMSVVDARLKVRGIEGLRVADASIMPTVTSGNTNAPSIMIGEKAAEIIRTDQAK